MSNGLLVLFTIGFVFGDIRRLRNLDFNVDLSTSGMAVTDVDGDGDLEVIVAVRNGPNFIVKYDDRTGRYRNIAQDDDGFYDAIKYTEGGSLATKYSHISSVTATNNVGSAPSKGPTVSVCACDIDGDGVDEIYLQQAIPATDADHPDRLLKRSPTHGYVDIFSHELNRGLAPSRGGRSVGCVDIDGSGVYAVLITAPRVDGQGVYILLRMNKRHKENNVSLGSIVLEDITNQAGLQFIRDARGIAFGPIIGMNDVFIANGNSYYVNSNTFRHVGSNCLFQNNGNGTFSNVANVLGLEDKDQNGRSVAIEDINSDGYMDILLTNWLGYNEIFLQTAAGEFTSFKEHNPDNIYSAPAASDIFLVGDFDNDGMTDVFINGANSDVVFPVYNRIVSATVVNNNSIQFRLSKENVDSIKRVLITGLTASDLNHDGIPELLVSHTAATNQGPTFSVFQCASSTYNWLRVLPTTRFGSPARGAKVTLTLSDNSMRQRVIGGSCSYKCGAEPVAHFGLGNMVPKELTIVWPDSHTVNLFLNQEDINKALSVTYSRNTEKMHVLDVHAVPTSTTSPIENSATTIAVLHVAFLLLMFS